LVQFVVICYIFPNLACLDQKIWQPCCRVPYNGTEDGGDAGDAGNGQRPSESVLLVVRVDQPVVEGADDLDKTQT
jgi:hypothetical protein